MAYDLNNKIILVTGGAAGIGFSCVKEILKAGAQAVTIADINELQGEVAVKDLTREFGPNRAFFVKTDITNADQFEAAFKKTIQTWKGIDVIINNAGVLNDRNWELEISINATAVTRGTLLGLQYLRKDKGGNGGVIVNIASILGLQEAPACPIYTATKHFVVGLSRSLGDSYHYDRTGVKIVTMCPGVTETTLVATADKSTLTGLYPDYGKFLVHFLAELPGQGVKNVAESVVTIITKAKSGSVWVAEGNEPVYEVNIPDRRTLRKT